MDKNLGFINSLEEIKRAAELMALSARTAPKSAGNDYVVIKIIEGAEVVKLGEEMIQYGIEKNKRNFDRDGENVKKSPVILLIGFEGFKNSGP